MIRRAGPPSVHALGFAGAAAGLLAVAALPLEVFSLFSCPWRAATGLPCPTCGCTRAFHHLVHGDLPAAFSASPLGALLALGCALHVAWTVSRLCGLRWAPFVEPTRRFRVGLAVAVAANWVFLAVRT